MAIDENKITPQWLAGFFDGEGCVSCYLAKGVMKLDVFVAQSHRPIIETIGRIFGERPRVHCKTKRICYSLHFSGRGCRPFLEYIKDHVIVKREQVFLALEMAALIGNSGPPKNGIDQGRRIVLGEQIRKLNHVDQDDLVNDGKETLQ